MLKDGWVGVCTSAAAILARLQLGTEPRTPVSGH
jgi:hypothetical protein